MKKLLTAAAVALCLGGCAQVDNFIQNDVINPTASLFENPNTKIVVNGIVLAAQVVAKDTEALACVVSAGSQVAGAIEANPAFDAGMSVQGTNAKIIVASSAACSALQGILSGHVTVPAGGTVVTAQ